MLVLRITFVSDRPTDGLSQGVIELRERRWVTRSTVASPTTIAQVREEVSLYLNRTTLTDRDNSCLGHQREAFPEDKRLGR